MRKSGDEFTQQGRNWGPDYYCLARVKEAFWKRRFLNRLETVGVVWKEGGEREQCAWNRETSKSSAQLGARRKLSPAAVLCWGIEAQEVRLGTSVRARSPALLGQLRCLEMIESRLDTGSWGPHCCLTGRHFKCEGKEDSIYPPGSQRMSPQKVLPGSPFFPSASFPRASTKMQGMCCGHWCKLPPCGQCRDYRSRNDLPHSWVQ